MTVFDFMASNADAQMTVFLMDDETQKQIDVIATSKNGGLAPTKYDNAEVLSWCMWGDAYAVFVNYIE